MLSHHCIKVKILPCKVARAANSFYARSLIGQKYLGESLWMIKLEMHPLRGKIDSIVGFNRFVAAQAFL
jgi:hypothetical protein